MTPIRDTTRSAAASTPHTRPRAAGVFPRHRPHLSELAFVTLLLVFAAGLRTVGLGFGAPNLALTPTDAARGTIHENTAVHPDEHLFVGRPLRMAATGQLNPKFFHNPSFLINLNFVAIVFSGAARGLSLEDFQQIGERSISPFPLYVVSRAWSMLGGLLAVAGTYAAARTVAGRRGAAAAGLVAACALPLVQHAHYSTTSSLAAGFAAVAVWASLTAAHRPHTGWLLVLGGMSAGLAAGNRYNAAAVLACVAVAAVVIVARAVPGTRRRALAWAAGGLLATPLVFLVTTPHVVFDTEFFLSEFAFIWRQYTGGEGIDWTTPYGLLFELRYLALFALGAPAALVALLGAAASVRGAAASVRGAAASVRGAAVRARPLRLSLLILGAFLVPYAIVVLRTPRPGHSDQLLVPILPAVLVFVGIGAAWLQERAARIGLPRRAGALVSAGLIAALCAVPLSLTLPVVQVLAQPDTRNIAQAWVEAHIPHGARIHLDGPYNIPLDPAHYTVSQTFGGTLPALDALRAQGVEYVLVSDAWYNDTLRSGEYVPADALATVRAHLAAYSTGAVWLAEVVRPPLPGRDWPMHTASVWHSPGLRIYRLIR
jgi:hypothetical protein